MMPIVLAFTAFPWAQLLLPLPGEIVGGPSACFDLFRASMGALLLFLVNLLGASLVRCGGVKKVVTFHVIGINWFATLGFWFLSLSIYQGACTPLSVEPAKTALAGLTSCFVLAAIGLALFRRLTLEQLIDARAYSLERKLSISSIFRVGLQESSFHAKITALFPFVLVGVMLASIDVSDRVTALSLYYGGILMFGLFVGFFCLYCARLIWIFYGSGARVVELLD